MKLMQIMLAAAFAFTGVSAVASTYIIDPSHTHARFAIGHMGTSTNMGGFYELTGQVEFDAKAKTGFIGITIPTNSLIMPTKAFTEHLKSDEFFDVKQYPTAYFKSTKWYFNGDKPSRIDGELTLKGKTLPVTLTATQFGCYDNPFVKAQSCGGDFTTTIDRTKFGISAYSGKGVPDEVKLNIQIEAYKK